MLFSSHSTYLSHTADLQQVHLSNTTTTFVLMASLQVKLGQLAGSLDSLSPPAPEKNLWGKYHRLL